MEFHRLTPDVNDLAALPEPERFLRAQAHIFATYYAHGCVTSAECRGQWFTACRHFLDEIEVKGLAQPELVAMVQGILDAAEQGLSPATSP